MYSFSPDNSFSHPIRDARFAAMNRKTLGLSVESTISAARHQFVMSAAPAPAYIQSDAFHSFVSLKVTFGVWWVMMHPHWN